MTQDMAKHEPPPVTNTDSEPVSEQLITMIRQRVEFGRQKYGTVLKTHNGRDALVDAMQEAIDMLQYQMQELLERRDERMRLERENTILRGIVAKMPGPCTYCGQTEMAQCPSGFPGCSRADDLMVGEEEHGRALLDEVRTLRGENEILQQWVTDLQGGMTINCVYCGHNYTAGGTEPPARAVLEAHIADCPKHPLFAARCEITALNLRLKDTQRLLAARDARLAELTKPGEG